jgi:hypothetical protein
VPIKDYCNMELQILCELFRVWNITDSSCMTHRWNTNNVARCWVLHEGIIPWASVIFPESVYDHGPVGKQYDIIQISEATNLRNSSCQWSTALNCGFCARVSW